MLIGAYGLHWKRDAYDWRRASGRRLVGECLDKPMAGQQADFSGGRGIYVLHNVGQIYYVGHTLDYGRFSGRLSDHTKLKSRHHDQWDAFSWFSFDEPSDVGDDGVVLDLDGDWDDYELSIEGATKGLEAIMISLLRPPGNIRVEKHGGALQWSQVTSSD